MKSPQFEGGYLSHPERTVGIFTFGGGGSSPVLTMGVKTITHNRDGLKLHAHQVVVVEISEGDETVSFDLPPNFARHYARRLLEFADAVEASTRPQIVDGMGTSPGAAALMGRSEASDS